jgi:acyl-CoA synthetase (AMP-forming)/AMP-acid ligase II
VISSTTPTVISLESLIADGEKLPLYMEVPLCSGESKKRIAYLIFSSGTSGLPKVALIRYTISHLLCATGCLHIAL